MMHDTAWISEETSALTEQLTANMERQAESSHVLLQTSDRLRKLTARWSG